MGADVSLTFEQQRDDRIIQRIGRKATAVLRKQNDIPPTVPMQVAGTAAAGTTQLTADAQIKTKLGRAVKGSKFTIAGVTGSFTLSEACESALATIVLKFTPALPTGGAANDALITWTQTYADWTFYQMRPAQTETTDKAVEKGTRVFQLAYKSGNEAPEVGDTLAGLPVIEVKPIAPGGPGTESRWRVVTGAKP
jgi:hypothetical protein